MFFIFVAQLPPFGRAGVGLYNLRKRNLIAQRFQNKIIFQAVDYPSFDIPGSDAAFIAWKKHKVKGIMTFRDNAYASVMTGTMAPLHHTPWKDALEDSMKSYLKS